MWEGERKRGRERERGGEGEGEGEGDCPICALITKSHLGASLREIIMKFNAVHCVPTKQSLQEVCLPPYNER